ncbi:unnamed protein product [Caenorhabditis auriculariae]|uniref:Uncharacterized protein n=1 Tax=Caenorhabditis auriculariae TaxID=2777116 RepID=A0A8S1HA84_9PELO|nr:unnamed protein product [Caenorhabditis auriculariae]
MTRNSLQKANWLARHLAATAPATKPASTRIIGAFPDAPDDPTRPSFKRCGRAAARLSYSQCGQVLEYMKKNHLAAFGMAQSVAVALRLG